MNLIPLSRFIPTVTQFNDWYHIKSISGNNRYNISSGNITEFYNNIFIEKLFSKQFKFITIRTNHSFNYNSIDREKVKNRSVAEIELLNTNNRVYVKKVYVILLEKNDNYEKSVVDLLNAYSDTEYEFICLEKEFKSINANNRRKPIKINFLNYDSDTSNSSEQIRRNFELYHFDGIEKFTLNYEYSFFNKNILSNSKIELNCSDVKSKIQILSKLVEITNNNLTNTITNRKSIKFLNDNIYEYGDDKIHKSVKFELIEVEENKFEDILSVSKILEEEYSNDNSHLSNFWGLIQSCLNSNPKDTWKKFNFIKPLFTEIKLYSSIKQQIVINGVKINLVYDTRTDNNLKLLHLIHNDDLEINLEKIAIGSNC